jgi:hypothetical protein
MHQDTSSSPRAVSGSSWVLIHVAWFSSFEPRDCGLLEPYLPEPYKLGEPGPGLILELEVLILISY